MSDVVALVVGLAVAYLAGSIPSAWLAGRAKGVDLRKHGSGNLGATNAWRVLGWRIGLLVYAVDTLKGALPVLLLRRPAAYPELAGVLYGVAAIAGHVRPIFLGFQKGGKGVATAGGVFFALAPKAFVIAFATFVAVFLASGFVSLGSLTAAIALPVALLVIDRHVGPGFVVGVLVAAFVFWTHRANIGRLRRGEENRFRFGRRATPTESPR
jgi:acyl phosphate:glycerol-3-phosphate acyltransferase